MKCAVCEEPAAVHGLCWKHHNAVERGKRRGEHTATCRECGEPAFAWGLCFKHYELRPKSPSGSRNGRSKLTDQQVEMIKQQREAGDTYAAISRRFGVSGKQVQRIVTGASRNVKKPDM
jgi:hypothetical protein